MGLLSNLIRSAVIAAVGSKLAKGRSPIVAALMMLLVSKALAAREEERPRKGDQAHPDNAGGLGALVEKFRQGGLEDLVKSWIGTGPNKPVAPNQLQQALGPNTVADLERETGMPREDLLLQLSRFLPEVIDKLSPDEIAERERPARGPEGDRCRAAQRLS